MGEMIQLKTADGAHIGAYKSTPGIEPRGSVVIVQEIFGINHHIRSVTDRIASAGYVGLAPAIFDRAEKGVELAYDAEGAARGMALARKITPDQHYLSIEAAIDTLASEGPVAIVGFCLGGTIAYAAAARNEFLVAAVGYYGGGIAAMAGADLNCPVELHFGGKDDNISAADVAKVQDAHPSMPIYTYPDAGHGFNCDERTAYHKPSADLAWSRTLSFLEQAMATRSEG